MDYRKETHFIVAYDGDKVRGKWDILTNQFVGIKGGILKGKSPAFTHNEVRAMNEVLGAAFSLASYADHWNPYTAERGQRLEEIVSVGLVIRHDWRLWEKLGEDTVKLDKACVDYIKTNFGGVYDRESISSYRVYKEYKDLLEKCGEQKEWATGVLREVRSDVPTDFVKGMILRGVHEKIFYGTRNYGFGGMINNWYDMIQTLGDKLEVKHNILTNYTILQWVHNEFKMAHYDETLKNNNNKAWLYYENDNYIVRPLLSRSDFHIEGEIQRNCVERMYMERVADGTTYVVAVRKKDNPNVPYITCEVDKKGNIRQFLLKCNRWVSEEADLLFRDEYQRHLSTSLE